MKHAEVTDLRILLVEDDFYSAHDLADRIAAAGGRVLGPVASVAAALALTHEGPVDGAILDVESHGAAIFAIADALARRGVPFLFTAGRQPDILPRRHSAVPFCAKQVSSARKLAVLVERIARSAQLAGGNGPPRAPSVAARRVMQGAAGQQSPWLPGARAV
ncbi:hypothetical protein ACFQXB_08695 [Plastorhodobacter daqingensis]|uniref:Response regulator n=1 Tax=Plastorhodobacter daqingensis TaxID=1387281 RepID=A0ABW2UJP4_9RHOB